MKKLCIQIGIILTLVMLAYVSHIRVSALQEPSLYFESLSSELYNNSKVKNIDTMLPSIFCSTVLDSDAFVYNQYLYDAKQSVFVYLFCKNIKNSGISSSYFTGKQDYFARTSFKELGFSDSDDDVATRDRCIPFSSDCDLAQHIPDLFDAIITDYMNMKQANVYGLIANFEDDKQMESQIKIFSESYFGIDICDDETDYPKACRTASSYIKNARNLLSDVSIFNITGILQTSFDCATTRFTENILYCGLYGDTTTSLDSFTNLVYNELFFYRLFVGYYLLELQKNPGILSQNVYNTNYSTITKKFSARYHRSQDALSLSLRMLRDTYMAYPFHIGFLMYQERLDGFGKLLAKITTPIYTLYDKLRNVQKPE